MATPPFVEVLVSLPVEGSFHYRVPPHLLGRLEPGHRVLVRFGRRRVTAFVVRACETLPEAVAETRLRPVEARLDPAPLVPPDVLLLARFAADYYLSPAGEVLKAALPPGLTAASKVRWVATETGRAALEHAGPIAPELGRAGGTAQLFSEPPEADPTQDELRALLVTAKDRGLSREEAARGAGRRLERLGLVEPRDQLSVSGGGGELTVIARRMPRALAEPYLIRAPARRALYDALSSGPRPLEELRAELGPGRVRAALTALEARGVLERRTVAAEAETSTEPGAAHARAEAERPSLTEAQRRVLSVLTAELRAPRPQGFLLFGVTGSGKTEIYLGVIEAALAQGRGALVLVPEIALTPQLEARFVDRFGGLVAVLHSGVPDGERRRRWRSLREGRSRIAVGPRSAVWAPVSRLGVVVVDEEHDGSFKQNTDLRYHGRDLAMVRARQAGALTVLGSATPSLESLHLVRQGKLTILELPSRIGNRALPEVEVVDLAEERRAMKGEPRLVSRALEDALRAMKDRGEQGIVFLNRRGFNTIVHCGACDDVKKCPHCDVSLTFHLSERKLSCHYCGFFEPLDTPCRSCRSRDVRPLGAGTERVTALLKEMIPDLRVLRLDRDVTQRAGGLDETLDAFRRGDADLLVGTQMVAKGHDFPRVTVVGIVLADASLAFPDFRAAERTFQLLTQVAGRAGRADRPGRVIVQTLQPGHYALEAAARHDVHRFLEAELPLREELSYPPFSRLGAVRLDSLDAERAEAAADRAAELARRLTDLRVLGPAPAPIARVKDRFRFLVLLFAPSPARLVGGMARVRRALADPPLRGVDVVFDVDASDLL